MRIVAGLITVNIIFSYFAEGGEEHCPDVQSDQRFVVGDTCYHFIEKSSFQVTYETSEADCKSRQGLLLSLPDKDTATKVEKELNDRADSHTILLGLRKVGGTWKWATGDDMTFDQFSQQPNSKDKHCAKLKLMDTIEWEKVQCGAADWFSIYVCEHNCFVSLVAGLLSVTLAFFLH